MPIMEHKAKIVNMRIGIKLELFSYLKWAKSCQTKKCQKKKKEEEERERDEMNTKFAQFMTQDKFSLLHA